MQFSLPPRRCSVACIALVTVAALPSFGNAQASISPDELFLGMQEGRYDAIIDVRTEEEWDTGGIAGATFVENLASTGPPDELFGCEQCTLALYSESGTRAGAAITRLRDEYRFTGTLHNAQGVSQWTDAGYPLVFQVSVTPECSLNNGFCRSQITDEPTESPTQTPTMPPTAMPSSEPSIAIAASEHPSSSPTGSPTNDPTSTSSVSPSPTAAQSVPSTDATTSPSATPSMMPSVVDDMTTSRSPTNTPTSSSSAAPTNQMETGQPTVISATNSSIPTGTPTSMDIPPGAPTNQPTGISPTNSSIPTGTPTSISSGMPTTPSTNQPTSMSSGNSTSLAPSGLSFSSRVPTITPTLSHQPTAVQLQTPSPTRSSSSPNASNAPSKSPVVMMDTASPSVNDMPTTVAPTRGLVFTANPTRLDPSSTADSTNPTSSPTEELDDDSSSQCLHVVTSYIAGGILSALFLVL